jgi:DME family drug/metabolite transporter
MMTRTSERKGAIAIFIGALLWSTGGLFIKEVTLNAWGVSFWRSSFAAITLYIIYRIQGKRNTSEPATNPIWISPFVILAALCYALLLVLFVLATKLTTSANAIFLQYTAPLYVLFAEPIIARSRLKRGDLITVIVSTAAMALFFIGKFETRSIWGNVAALASGVAFAAYAILLKHERATDANRWQIIIMGHTMIAVSMGIVAILGFTVLSPTPQDLIDLLYLGIVQIGIAYAFFTYGISHIRAIDATLISMIEPVLNPIWVYLGIGERPTNYAIVGGLIILSVSIIRTIRGNPQVIEVEEARSGE